ncbi:PA14 domain-containing protein [Streptomyces sp. NPDC002920]
MNPARRTTAAAATVAATTAVLATAGGLLAAAPASAATTCTSPVFKRQFFANTTFSGTPKKTDCDSAVDENWSTRAPASGLPKDNFGVRWTVTRDFGSGSPFALSVSAQDGVRVYVDNVRKINIWKNVSATASKTLNLTLPKGKHTVRVDYASWTGKANVKFTYAPRTSAAVDKVKPLVPTGLAVSYDRTTAKAKLTWAQNKELDLAGYRVYRRPLDATTWTRQATTASTTYTDTTLPVTGASYAYELRAYDKAGNESAGTAVKTVTTVDRTAPSAPSGLAADSESTGLKVTWSAVTDASSYRVYRSTSAAGTYSLAGSTVGVSYLDTEPAEGSTRYYRVTALDAAGNESARSNAVSGKRRDLTPPDAVTGMTVTPTEYGFELNWDANPAPDLFRYVVYTGELLRDEEDQVCSAHQEVWLAPGVTSYRYTTLPDGVERCFLVDVYDTSWNSPYD